MPRMRVLIRPATCASVPMACSPTKPTACSPGSSLPLEPCEPIYITLRAGDTRFTAKPHARVEPR